MNPKDKIAEIISDGMRQGDSADFIAQNVVASQILGELPPNKSARNEEIARRYYVGNEELKDLGPEFGLTPGGASQVVQRPEFEGYRREARFQAWKARRIAANTARKRKRDRLAAAYRSMRKGNPAFARLVQKRAREIWLEGEFPGYEDDLAYKMLANRDAIPEIAWDE